MNSSIKSFKSNSIERIHGGIFNDANDLNELSLPNVTTVVTYTSGYSAFKNTKLVSLDLPNLTSVGGGTDNSFILIRDNALLTTVNLPKLQTIQNPNNSTKNYIIYGNLPKLSEVTLGEVTELNGRLIYLEGPKYSLTELNMPKLTTINTTENIITINITPKPETKEILKASLLTTDKSKIYKQD
ncbi:UNVERIFIED_CONTAM: hypothetical protein O8I53_08650 [Campylobacter lari]